MRGARLREIMVAEVATLAWVFACGARTGLLEDQISSPTLDGSDGASEQGGEDGGGSGVFCSLNEGPVSSCDAGPAAGPVQRCGPGFAVCTQILSPGWGCCSPDQRECEWQQFLPDAGCM